ncbi:MAG: carboxylating nicotinate-nucleotide diphosphorylase [Acidobacteria bacterium]|nr:carboxylating nicotinate-nucleotide diphosphorylase [Acidobacteriota bacterium]
MLEAEIVRRAVCAALEEDLGPGDVTSRVTLDPAARARGVLVAREPLVVAGLPVAREVFRQVDPSVAFQEACRDGDQRAAGEGVATVEGAVFPILAGERTALNFLQRMSGIATATRRAVELVGGTRTQISDTRKTAPGLRPFDKYAVRAGGGTSHRAGLFDAVLIKDNHCRLAGGVGRAVRGARRRLREEASSKMGIEVEADTLDDVREALAAGADGILLDNMDRETVGIAVELAHGRVFLEVSGGVREADIPFLAGLGVDRISLGSLTHSVRAVDLALDLVPA